MIDKDGVPAQLQPDALRIDDDGISSNWIEYFPGSWPDQLLRTRYIMNRTMKVRQTGRLAVAKVGTLEDAAKSVSKTVSVIHEPEPINDAHALISGVPRNDDELAVLLATKFQLRPIHLKAERIDTLAASYQDNYTA